MQLLWCLATVLGAVGQLRGCFRRLTGAVMRMVSGDGIVVSVLLWCRFEGDPIRVCCGVVSVMLRGFDGGVLLRGCCCVVLGGSGCFFVVLRRVSLSVLDWCVAYALGVALWFVCWCCIEFVSNFFALQCLMMWCIFIALLWFLVGVKMAGE